MTMTHAQITAVEYAIDRLYYFGGEWDTEAKPDFFDWFYELTVEEEMEICEEYNILYGEYSKQYTCGNWVGITWDRLQGETELHDAFLAKYNEVIS